MPKYNMHLNQSDDDKGTKKKSYPLSGDPNATHKIGAVVKDLHQRSQEFSEQVNVVTVVSYFKKFFPEKSMDDGFNQKSIEEFLNYLFEKLEEGFPNLIAETNTLHESVNKLPLFQKINPNEAYIEAEKLVPLHFIDAKISKKLEKEKEDKEIFIQLLEALGNTDVVLAELHEVTLFKIAALYNIYAHTSLSFRVVEMLVALLATYTYDLPDALRYKEVVTEDATYGTIKIKCNWLEVAQKAYEMNINNPNEVAKQRFSLSCKNLIQCYEGIKWLIKEKKLEEKKDSLNGIYFPEVPSEISSNNSVIPIKVLDIFFYDFKGREFYTLLSVVQQHKNIFIPLNGLALDIFMRACLSKQEHLKDTKDEDLKKRNHYLKFAFDVYEVAGNVIQSLKELIQGKVFRSERGLTSFLSNPDIFYAEITKLFNEQKLGQISSKACKLSGIELIEAFFKIVYEKLNQTLEDRLRVVSKEKDYKEAEKDISSEKYKEAKKIISNFYKLNSKLSSNDSKSVIVKKANIIKENKQQILEMQIFEAIVKFLGAQNIRLFPDEASDKAGFSFPKEYLQDVEAIIAEYFKNSDFPFSSFNMAARP